MSLVPIPLLTVASVPAASEWYQRVLGLVSVHGGDEYDQLATVGPDGPTTVLQLHRLDTHDHDHLVDPALPLGGNGVAVWFETAGYAEALTRIHAAVGEGRATVLEDDHVNPRAHHREVWLGDLDGYTVVISSPHGSV